MSLHVSRPAPHGHLIVADLPVGAEVVCRFADDSDALVIDADDLPDLVLYGLDLDLRREVGIDGQPAPDEQVEACRLEVVGGPAPVLLHVHPASRNAQLLGWEATSRLLALALAELITAGVAEDLAEAPEDASALEGDGGDPAS
jgi:hypothetical protein